MLASESGRSYRKSFHNVSNVASNVNLPLAWPIHNIVCDSFVHPPHVLDEMIIAVYMIPIRQTPPQALLLGVSWSAYYRTYPFFQTLI